MRPSGRQGRTNARPKRDLGRTKRHVRKAAVVRPVVVEPVRYATMPIYPHDSVRGPIFGKKAWTRHPLPAPVGEVDGFGHRAKPSWEWNDPCPKCGTKTEFGYCTRCVWVCENSARPKPEPLLTGVQAVAA